VMAFREIENQIHLKEPFDKTRMFRTLLKCQAMFYFEHYFRKRLEAKDSKLSDNVLIEFARRELYKGLGYIPMHTIHV
jgi:hypothetical protein